MSGDPEFWHNRYYHACSIAVIFLWSFAVQTAVIVTIITVTITLNSCSSRQLPGAVDHSLSIVSHDPEQNCQTNKTLLQKSSANDLVSA